VLTGGFRYTEVASTNTRPIAVIVSRTLKSLVVLGNFATIKADGFWNGVLCDLTVECRDQNPAVDWFHIRAVPINSLLPAFYDAAGTLVKGDIVVFSQPAPFGYAKGFGTIATTNSCIGRFQFSAESTSAGVRGSINYVDYNPMAMSPIIRPRAVIYVPQVKTLTIIPGIPGITGNVALLGGPGTLNGRPALVEVRAIDNSLFSGAVRRDEFYIKATPLTTDAISAIYQAGGPLTFGDIVVAPKNGR
jgi:hypothetical protein